MAFGGACGMVSIPAVALELGQLEIDSTLGQPLRASIAYALNPNEQLYDFCVYLRPGVAANGLPVVSNAKVSVSDGVIRLAGNRAIGEPLLTMQLSIDCPYTAHLSREYTLMLNPAQSAAVKPVADESPVTEGAASATSTAAVRPPLSRPRVHAPTGVSGAPIAENSRYLVRRGDSLSAIASRISDRSIALWPAVDRIFAANPDAFMNNDRDLLKAGIWLLIPNLSGAAAEPVSVVAGTIDTAPATAYDGYQATPVAGTTGIEQRTHITETETLAPEAIEHQSVAPPVLKSDTAVSEFADLQPGDVVVGHDSPFVSPIGSPADPDTAKGAISDSASKSPAAAVKTGQTISVRRESGASWSWLMWLAGTGFALILGLLLFGQNIRRRFGSVAVGAASESLPGRRRSDGTIQKPRAFADVDFPVPDSLSHSSSIALDADFGDGTGLRDNSEMHVAQDFGFSASSTFDDELDMVLPETTGEAENVSPTDIIPPPEVEGTHTILESEIMPGADDVDEDYDLSMIVDVTKQNVVESDATTKDLQAVQIAAAGGSKSDDYTLSQEVDYKILEQDYQEEFTATQALNLELAKAAAELAGRMDTDSGSRLTTRLPKNTHAENDEITSVDDRGISEEVTAEYPDLDNEVTVEMPSNEHDVTAEMEIESGKIDTKKRAS